MSVKERLKKFIKSEKITISDFEKEISVSNGYVNSISKSIGLDKLNTIIEKYPNLSLNWLITGNGGMLSSSYSSKESVSSLQEDFATYTTKSNEKIPFMPLEAFAGNGDDSANGVLMHEIEENYVVPLFDGLKIDFMMSVRGSSMYPKYSSGDVVACRSIKELLFVQWNKVYILDTISQGVLMKRLKKHESEDKVVCKSDNKDYDEFVLPKSDIRNIALVVGVIRLE